MHVEPAAERIWRGGALPWLASGLFLGRLVLLCAMELSHHGEAGLALLRLREAAPAALVVALALALLGSALGRAARKPCSALRRALLVLAFAAPVLAFLAGFLGRDPSLRVTADTGRGVLVLGALALVVVVLAAAFVLPGPESWAQRRARAACLPAWSALALCALAPHLVPSPLARPLELASVLSELARAPFEILAAHAATPPGRGLLAPGRDTDVAGAARPALLLPPPAQVRFALGQGEELWLTGGVAVDQSMEEAAAARYPGHAVLFELHLDGRPLFRARVALSGSPRWVELGDGAGLALGAAKELSLRTRLVDAEDHEVVPPDALRVGFGGLCLERRETVARASASRARPNLVFVLLDTLRADRTSAYGYARPTTPHLAELAARGTLFAEAHASASWTWPSVASLFTGLTPEEHGVVDAVRSFLPESLETLAEALQRAGFSTAGWSGSPLIVPSKQFDQGFEFFDASRAGFLRRADLLVPPALEWLERVRDQRFFLYLHLMEPHAPYLPLEEPRRAFAPEVPDDFDAYDMLAWQWDLRRAGFDGAGRARTDAVVPAEKQRWASDLYDAGVSSADHWVGVVLAKLAELELTEETIVVVTSDHGEELFEHGLFTHGHSLHRELVRVPLIVAGPGIPVGERVAGLRSTNALGATLLRRLGLEPGSQWPAVDLFADEAETVWFSTRQGWWNGRANQALYGLRRGALSLVFAPTGEPWGGGEPGSVALFDRALDPAEEQDLAARRPADTAALRALLEQRLDKFDVGQVDPLDTPDAATLDMLRDIGYLGR